MLPVNDVPTSRGIRATRPPSWSIEINSGKPNSDLAAAFCRSLLKQAKLAHKKTVFVSLRAPYDIAQFGKFGDAVLATYAYNIDVDTDEKIAGPAFTALANVLLGKAPAKGQLPVTINDLN